MRNDAQGRAGFDPDAHDWRCDWVRYPTMPDSEKECYCPTSGERATRECGHLVDIECGCQEW